MSTVTGEVQSDTLKPESFDPVYDWETDVDNDTNYFRK